LETDAAQNTVRDPYNKNPEQEAQWLATYLYHRFYRLPDGVKVMLLRGTNKLGDNRQFLPITARLPLFERHETAQCSGGIQIHYLYDAPYGAGSGHNKSISGAIASAVSSCAVIYKDEMYDLRRGKSWTFDAPIFGIPFGAKHISVHVELPNDYDVVPDGYRQFLRYGQGEQPNVGATDFAELVRENRPQWLIDVIRSLAPDSTSSDDIRNELQRLLNQLRVRRLSPKVLITGSVRVSSGAGAASEQNAGVGTYGGADNARSRPADLSIVPVGAKRAEIFKNAERAPEIIQLYDDDEIEQKGIKGRAARYVMQSGELFVNMQYPCITEMRTQLEAEYADASDPEMMRALVKQHAERTIILGVGRTVVYALAKQLNKEWDQKALDVAFSPESLSMAADDFADALQNIRRDIGRRLRVTRATTEMGAISRG
jgi:hypothetical protein